MSAFGDKHLSDSNYTALVDVPLGRDGKPINPSWFVHAEKVAQREEARERAEVSSEEDTARAGGFPLSKSHTGRKTENSLVETKIGIPKSPSVSWVSGASIFKTSQGSDGEQVGGGKRGSIEGFSTDSRRRLMCVIASIRRDAELPSFVTLTYPNKFPSPAESKRHLKIFCQRLKYFFPSVSAIWKLEPQERGAPHYHLLVWGVSQHDLFSFVVNAWYDIAGDGDKNHLLFHLGLLKDSKPCVSKVRSWRGVWSYASKYLGKTFEVAGWDNLYTGRFWGYINRELIPFGELCKIELSSHAVFHVMRYQKRFSGRRVFEKGYTLFCDANQWAKNILQEVAERE